MKKLLHIIASPREEKSRTLKVSQAFLNVFQAANPQCTVDTLNLFKESIPDLTTRRLDGKYMLIEGKELYGSAKEAWEEVIQHIERFLSADLYLVSTPMWNFHIPYIFKKYIDVIVQPSYLFRRTEKGFEGLAKNKKMLVVSSRGEEYSSPEMHAFDFQEPYLRALFGFIGISDITFLKAEPMDEGESLEKQRLSAAEALAKTLAGTIHA